MKAFTKLMKIQSNHVVSKSSIHFKSSSQLISKSSSPIQQKRFFAPLLPQQVFNVRKGHTRNHVDTYSWLSSYNSFSFASYFSSEWNGSGVLRVLNEDRVAPSQGFEQHPHKRYEIISYCVDGELTHQDSMGNTKTLTRGSMQLFTTGTYAWHSEMNNNANSGLHFLQIWILPKSILAPHYQLRTMQDENSRHNKLLQMIAPRSVTSTTQPPAHDQNLLQIHQDLNFYSCILDHNQKVLISVKVARRAYIHVIMKEGCSVVVNCQPLLKEPITLVGGDGLAIEPSRVTQEMTAEDADIVIVGNSPTPTEFVIMEYKHE